MIKTYLGDSVYADFDGYSIILTTNNGYPDDPRNVIVLEPQVFDNLNRFVDKLTTPPAPPASDGDQQPAGDEEC